MNKKLRVGTIGLLLALCACAQQDQEVAGISGTPQMQGLAALQAGPVRSARSFGAIAASPDRGALVNYDRRTAPSKQGAFTSHRVEVSEDHAIKAIVTGKLRIPAPGGEYLQLNYARHAENLNGNWTWVGRLAGGDSGQEAIITFGEKAVFGTIPQGGGRPDLKLTTRNGKLWVVETDPRLAPRIDRSEQDTLVPVAAARDRFAASTPSSGTKVTESSTASATTSSSNTIDVLLGYTRGFAVKFGGQSQAVTRLTHLVDVNNQAYVNSRINGIVRLVGTQQVDYTDGGTNKSALIELTGSDGSKSTTVPASLLPLRAARDTLGADLVALVRLYEYANEGCGIAWLLGAGQQEINSSDSPWGYSIVSNLPDGTSVAGTDGKNYYCSVETLSHELGHLMGSAHDVDNSTKDDGTVRYGRYSYSFGAKTDPTGGNFYTVMSYGDDGQTSYRVFSNPSVTSCGGLPCGVADKSDNARSLNQTIPIVSTFRAAVVAQPKLLNLRSFAKMGASGTTELHELDGATTFQSFTQNRTTALGRTDVTHSWELQSGDYNRDGIVDVFSINKNGASGRTEIHVMDGRTNQSTFLAHIASALPRTGSNSEWLFRVGDYNADGILDVYAIGREGASGRTEVHVLDGATSFQTYLANIATVINRTGTDGGWNFELGDFNRDGILDIYAIAKNAAASTEVHVLNGATLFQSFLLQTRTALNPTGADHSWVIKLGDYNRDGVLDIYAINRVGESLRTEVHVLDGAGSYRTFLAHIATALNHTGSDGSWAFEVVQKK